VGLIQKSVIYLFGRVLPALIGFGGVALYTRMLDPASVGAFALLLSISLLSSAVGFSWLRVAALRLAAGSVDDSDRTLIATVAVSFAATAAIVAAVEVGVLHFIKPGLSLSSLSLAVAAAAASAWYELNGTMLQARLSVLAWGLLSFARAAVALGCSLVLIRAGLKTDALRSAGRRALRRRSPRSHRRFNGTCSISSPGPAPSVCTRYRRIFRPRRYSF
jgi:O-antigen/teichoic acid export membrane protein